MNFNDFSNKITFYKTANLGGQASQFKLAPKIRIDFSEEKIKEQNPKKAAVLALFYPDKNNNTRFLLTQRASYKGTHSAQISLVGGKTENNETSKQTAIREAHEEVGINPSEINIIRKLSSTYIPPSNFWVTPFLGVANYQPTFNPNYEVNKIIEVLAEDLLNDTNLSLTELETSYLKKTKVPCFTLNKHIVWGATAMILSEIKDLLKSFK